MHVPDSRIYQSARLFAEGRPIDEIKDILLGSFDFDEDYFEEIIALAKSHSSDIDNGYSAFIKAVNKVLGKKNVYCVDCSKKKLKWFFSDSDK